MHIRIICVGRLKSGPEREIFGRYEKRFIGLGRQLGFSSLTLTELNESRAAHLSARQDEEARAVLAKCPPNAHLVLLDERGKSLTSSEFAQWLGKYRENGVTELCFALGGPDGHGQPMRKAAKMAINLGHMTLPHGLARIVLSEQLYRAATILTGHPYHRQ